MPSEIGNFEINNKDEFKHWLRDQPVEVARVMAHRAAMRVFPVITRAVQASDFRNTWRESLIKYIFRRVLRTQSSGLAAPAIVYDNYADAYAASMVSVRASDYESEAADDLANTLATAARATAPLIVSHEALSATRAAAQTARIEDAHIKGIKGSSLATIAVTTRAIPGSIDDLWKNITADAHQIATGNGAEALLASPLWENGNIPPAIAEDWANLQAFLIQDDPNWAAWIWFYEGVLKGIKSSNPQQDLITEIARIPDKDWNASERDVNNIITKCYQNSL